MSKCYYCVECGSEVPPQSDQQLQPLLTCQACGARFSTPEHERRYRTALELTGAFPLRNAEERDDAADDDDYYEEYDDDEEVHERPARPSLLGRAAGAVGMFFLGLTGRLILFGLGWGMIIAGLPLLFRYGFLRGLYPKLLSIYGSIPFIGTLYPQTVEAGGGGLTAQLLTALLLAAGLALVRQRRSR